MTRDEFIGAVVRAADASLKSMKECPSWIPGREQDELEQAARYAISLLFLPD